MIYFIKPKNIDVVKIGKSNNPIKRLADLQVGAFETLILLKTIKAKDDLVEIIIHKSFKEQRTNSGNEWYRLNNQINCFIAKLDDTKTYTPSTIKNILIDLGISLPKLHKTKENKSFQEGELKINNKKLLGELKRRGLKQYQLAALANLSPASISVLLKRRNARIATINKIAKVLGVDGKDLMI